MYILVRNPERVVGLPKRFRIRSCAARVCLPLSFSLTPFFLCTHHCSLASPLTHVRKPRHTRASRFSLLRNLHWSRKFLLENLVYVVHFSHPSIECVWAPFFFDVFDLFFFFFSYLRPCSLRARGRERGCEMILCLLQYICFINSFLNLEWIICGVAD